MNGKQRKIYILLTRLSDNGSKAIGFFTRCFYTHASIGLEEDLNTFYSFRYKGFMTEKISYYLRPDKTPPPCQLYELSVSERKYNAVKKIINDFIKKRSIYRYAKLGIIFGLLRIKIKQKNRYTCSSFVAEVLSRSKAVELKKDSALYYASDFHKLSALSLIFQGNLKNYFNKFIPKTI